MHGATTAVAHARPTSMAGVPGGSTMPSRAAFHPIVAFAFTVAVASLAAAQTGNDAVYQYNGADRNAQLIERAKQEGRVVLYTSLAPTESQPLAQAFEKKYGIKVERGRARSD